ncbi:MAG: tetratricopeptide repeat protein [Deltaproteobacteria bacterium]|nr:tetratricopeptide repeat protein [Deltaproteobacteria bacterium]
MAESKDKLLRRIDLALQGKKLKRARNLLRKVIELDPNDIRSRLRLGEVQFQLGDKDDAVALLAQVGDYYRDHGFLLKSVAVYKKMLEVDPSRWELHGELASLYFRLGMAPEAVKQHKVQARALLKQGRVVESLHVVRQILDLEPGNVKDRVRLAEAFSQHEQYEDASREFREVLSILAKKNSRGPLWIQVSERYLHHNMQDVEVARGLVEKLLELGRHNHALPWLQLCFDANPGDLGVLDMLATCFEALGQPNKAIAVLKVLSGLYGKRGLKAESDGILLRVLEVDPKDVTANRALGRDIAGSRKEARTSPDLELDWDLPKPVEPPPEAPPPLPPEDEDVEFGFEEVWEEGAQEVTLVQAMDEALLKELGLLDDDPGREGLVDVGPLKRTLKEGKALTAEDLIRKGVHVEPSEVEELDFFHTAGLTEEAGMLVNEILQRHQRRQG